MCLGLQGEDMEIIDGICSIPCVIDENCPESPGGTATPLCLDLMGSGYCLLECDDGKTCPAGMECVVTNMGMGPSYCF